MKSCLTYAEAEYKRVWKKKANSITEYNTQAGNEQQCWGWRWYNKHQQCSVVPGRWSWTAWKRLFLVERRGLLIVIAATTREDCSLVYKRLLKWKVLLWDNLCICVFTDCHYGGEENIACCSGPLFLHWWLLIKHGTLPHHSWRWRCIY